MNSGDSVLAVRAGDDPTGSLPNPLPGNTSRWWIRTGALALAVMCGVGGTLAYQHVTKPPTMPQAEVTSTVIAAKRGHVHKTMRTVADARWAANGQLAIGMTGTITKVHLNGPQTLKPGTKVVDVDLKPVVAAAGTIPQFREFTAGLKGDDVRQLQQFLRSTGHRSSATTGEIDTATTDQIKSWQQATGQEQTGIIPAGQLLFIDDLPKTAFLGSNIKIGAKTSGDSVEPEPGEQEGRGSTPKGVVILPATPSFTLKMPAPQTEALQVDMLVTLDRGEDKWQSSIESIKEVPGDPGNRLVLLKSTDAEPICRNKCNTIPPRGDQDTQAVIELVARTEGTTLPTTAIALGADGKPTVRLTDGNTKEISIKATVDGVAVVEGISERQEVVVTGNAK